MIFHALSRSCATTEGPICRRFRRAVRSYRSLTLLTKSDHPAGSPSQLHWDKAEANSLSIKPSKKKKITWRDSRSRQVGKLHLHNLEEASNSETTSNRQQLGRKRWIALRYQYWQRYGLCSSLQQLVPILYPRKEVKTAAHEDCFPAGAPMSMTESGSFGCGKAKAYGSHRKPSRKASRELRS